MYEYKVVPAPARAAKVKGLKTTGDRFAHVLTEALNDLGAEGWEFLRTETLPCEERKGWFGGVRISTQIVMIYRRTLKETPVPDIQPALRLPAAAAEPAEVQLTGLRAVPPAAPAASTVSERDTNRAEPVFRPGAMMRTEPERRFPPMRKSAEVTPPPEPESEGR